MAWMLGKGCPLLLTAPTESESHGRSVRQINPIHWLRVPAPNALLPEVAQRYRTRFLSQFVPKNSKKRT